MKRWNGKNADKAAGTSRKDGRVAVCLNYYGKTHMIYASRIIFALINGKWPDGLVDHLDGNPGNNKLENLRVCNKSHQKSSVIFCAAFGRLNPLPHLIHFFERAVLNSPAGAFELVFHFSEPREKAAIGGVQFAGRVGVQEPGEVHNSE